MNHLKISVCLATYNGEAYIRQQLTSILTQLNQDDEVIISDDHSTDDTLNIIATFQDSRIKIYTNPNQPGAVNNFENALKQATGEIIFLADQDDVWFPEKVKIQVALLEKNDLVLSDAIVVDELGNVQHPSFFKMNYSGKGLIRNWVNNSYMGCCMAFNRKVLTYVLPFPEKIAMHDSWIGLNASLIGKCYFLNTPLIHYRRHGKNTMASFKKNHLPVIYQISYRLYMMYQVLKRRLFS
ncbi:MAG: glycosyltransferase family 2 protein [Bacteroidia bacterium]|nr:glycosyltransferase family 2 protein [Bacteroidia bacterium]